ncbi:MAG: adenylate/guanylate cyclase domain-containing protein [Leptolyngbyaceae cyanobacterium]
MNLRQKTLLLTICPMVGLIAVLYSCLSIVLQRSYTQLEQQAAQRNLERVEEVITGDLDQLQFLTEDWASGNDVYQFMDDAGPDFIKSNFEDNVFASLELNFIVFATMEGEIIHGKGYDLELEEPIPIPVSLKQQLGKNSPLLRFPHIAHHYSGFIPVDDRLMLVAVEPILRSDETGPINGVLLMGRYLDEAKVEDIELRTKLDLEIYRPSQLDLPKPLQVALQDLNTAHGNTEISTTLRLSDANALAGYVLFPGVYEQPQLLVQTILPRDIYQQGQITIGYLGFALLGACGISILSIGLLLERVILRRLVKLSREVQHIGRSNDLTLRVDVEGNDELGSLGECVNDMLGELQVSNEKLTEEQQKAERLLLNILPAPVANELMHDSASIPQHFDEVTILFADIVGFTPLSKRLPPIELVSLLNKIFSAFDGLADNLGLEKIKTIGDAYMVAAGLPIPREDHVEAIAEMALAMLSATSVIQTKAGEDLEIRIGINTGVVVAGVIGTKKFIYDMWGDAVNIASRMESSSKPGKIQVTAATYEKLKDEYVLERRGLVPVKGRGEMETYWLEARRPEKQAQPQLEPLAKAN